MMETADVGNNCARVLDYILAIIQTDGIDTVAKLAALTILQKLFTQLDGLKTVCMNSDLISALLLAIDSGLSVNCDPDEVVYVSMAMEVMSQLSKLPIGNMQKMVTETSIRGLLAYLDMDSEFYRFSATMTTVVKELCENKQLIGKVKVVPMGPDPLKYIHRHTKHKLKSLPKLPEVIHQCYVYDTTSSEDIEVSRALVDQRLAWNGCLPGSGQVETPDEWQDMIVTEVLDGGIFWAHVGEDTIREVGRIQRVLNHECSLERHPKLRLGENVVIHRELLDTSGYFRAHVLRMEGCHVEVFVLDYGFILHLLPTQVYTLPDQLQMSVCPSKVSLCSVAGICPPPYDTALLQNSVAVLANICKQSMAAGEMLSSQGGIDHVLRLLDICDDPTVVLELLNLLNNLTINNNVKQQLGEKLLVPRVLAMLKKDVEEGAHVPRLNCVTGCLVNLLFRSPDNRKLFYEHQGIEIVSELISKYGRFSSLYKKATKLLRVFIGSASFSAVPVSTKDSRSRPGYIPKYVQQQQAEMERSHADDASLRSVPPGSVAAIAPRPRLAETLQRSLDQPRPVEKALHHSRLQQATTGDGTPELSDDEAEHHSCRGLNMADIHKNLTAKSYVLGSTVNFRDDTTHELRPNTTIQGINKSSIAQHVCAMLNCGKGGMVYFGIDKDGVVFGLEMSRDDKDQFRLGIDQLMHRCIVPVLLHFQFDFHAVPVVDPSDMDKLLEDLYVVEISVTACARTVYTLSNGICYYRFDEDTCPISRYELRHLVVMEEESHYHQEIQQLQAERDALLRKIAAT